MRTFLYGNALRSTLFKILDRKQLIYKLTSFWNIDGRAAAKYRRIEFFKRADGTKPVGEWLRGLDDERATAIASGLSFFEEYSQRVLPKRLYEKATDHIWEIKVHYGNEQFRLFAFPDGDAVIIAVHAKEKKDAKLKKRDLILAEDRRREYLARKKPPKNILK